MRYLCKRVQVEGQWDVELWQNGFDRFTVVYGKQISVNVDYAEAALEFGRSIMHALSCAGTIDNRTKAEAKAAGDASPVFSTD